MSSEATTLLLDYAQETITVVTAEGTVEYVNGAVRETLGFEPDELSGSDAFEYVHPDDRERVRATFESIRTAAGASADTDTYRHRTADGSWVWLESRMSNLSQDALGGYVISSREVTDRVEADARCRETESRLQEIADQTSEVLWVFNDDFTELLFCNERCRDIYGADPEQLRADPRLFLDCIHPDDVPAVRDAMDCLGEGQSVDLEYRVNPDSDYTNWVWVQGEPIVEDGDVVRIVGFARDITDRRRRERQLVVMDTLLRHNLRNDMNAIIGNAELIERDPGETATERAAVIRRVGEQLIETTNKQREIINLLDDPSRPQRVELTELIDHAVEMLSETFPDATIERTLEPDLSARALPQIELAVTELLENALRHAEVSEPTATVIAREDGDTAEIEIRDRCPPLPEHEYQVLTGEMEMTATYHSTGLGLWLVYWIVDLSNGQIQFTRADEGNVATITVPRS